MLRLSSTQRAFGALRADGAVVVWGDPKFGGECPRAIKAGGMKKGDPGVLECSFSLLFVGCWSVGG